MGSGMESCSIPLIKSSFSSSTTGTTSSVQTLGNIIVSIVGTGLLGLPFAFRNAGWFAGSMAILLAGAAAYYCMLLLVQCRDKQAAEELTQETITYGDLGYKCMGNFGRYITEFVIFTSQCGGSVAYLVFISQNLSSIFDSQNLSLSSFIFLLVPFEIALSWIDSLSGLAPFSMFADVCNVLAMVIVVKEDVKKVVSGEFKFNERTVIASDVGGLAFAGGMAVFCFDGFSMTLALEASMRERTRFPSLLGKAFFGISLVYALFGFSGYMAYGDQTKDIITLNLPHNPSSITVQIGLCLGLMFTIPIILHPVHEIMESKLESIRWCQDLYYNKCRSSSKASMIRKYVSRAILIIILAVLASFVPGFGEFTSLVGSTVSALISFVLPASFHLILLGPSLKFWQKGLDYFFVIFGLLFAIYGTYNSIVGV
ncbi:Amino acid transporter ANT1 [Euphorbia peplus]|nr:Amino acid transporter ANT1 [Euphorbia peplus]